MVAYSLLREGDVRGEVESEEGKDVIVKILGCMIVLKVDISSTPRTG